MPKRVGLARSIFKKMNLILDSISMVIKEEIEFFSDMNLLIEGEEVTLKRSTFMRAIELASALKTSLRG